MAAALYPQAAQQPVAPVAQQQPKLKDPFGGTGVQTPSGGWLPASHPDAAKYQTAAPAPAGTPQPVSTQVPQGQGNTYSTPGQQGGPTIQTQFRDSLLKQLQTDPNNVSLSDPSLAPQMQAYQNAQQRSQQRAQQELAEQAFAGGTRGTGAYGAELNAMEQARGEAEAQYGAGLLQDEKTQRLESLFNALGLGQQQVQGDEQLKQAINAGNQQFSLGQSDIALRKLLGQGNLSLGVLQALLGNRQANDQLGVNSALGLAGINAGATKPFI